MNVYKDENGIISTTKNYYILNQQFSAERFILLENIGILNTLFIGD